LRLAGSFAASHDSRARCPASLRSQGAFLGALLATSEIYCPQRATVAQEYWQTRSLKRADRLEQPFFWLASTNRIGTTPTYPGRHTKPLVNAVET
jgi:hypothetical protein